jgi:dCMP deaminase
MRPDINEILMETALLYSKRSTCLRLQVGAVIALDNRIVSTGYNGSAHNHKHCQNHFQELYSRIEHTGAFKNFDDYIKSDVFKEAHGNWSKENELHAEMNAIMFCAKEGKSIKGGTIYTTISPCLFCTKAIIGAGIKTVWYNELYDRPEGHKSIELLKSSGIKVLGPMSLQKEYKKVMEIIDCLDIFEDCVVDCNVTHIDKDDLLYEIERKFK